MSNTRRRNKLVGRVSVLLGTFTMMGAFLTATTKASIDDKLHANTSGSQNTPTVVNIPSSGQGISSTSLQAIPDFRTRSS